MTLPYEVFILDNSPELLNWSFAANENYIFLGQNIGTGSRNIGIDRANSPICLLLDDDSHPFPGAVEALVAEFKKLPANCAGLTAEIHNPDGGREASLLPTVFHGAGVAFKTAILRENRIYYPEEFCFYGEEYRLTLEIYKAGFKLQKSSSFKVMHRRSDAGRDLHKIFYHLGRNNRIIWQDIVPAEYREDVCYDSQRRYELTAAKEGVEEAFYKGLKECAEVGAAKAMTAEHFMSFALLDKFKSLKTAQNYILCGAGKFPSLWAGIIEKSGATVHIADFNRALIGRQYKNFKILAPQDVLDFDGVFITGHSSEADTEKWQQFLKTNRRKYLAVDAGYEPDFC